MKPTMAWALGIVAVCALWCPARAQETVTLEPDGADGSLRMIPETGAGSTDLFAPTRTDLRAAGTAGGNGVSNFGTIAFGSTRFGRFSDTDLELLKTLADQFAATSDRARLLESLL